VYAFVEEKNNDKLYIAPAIDNLNLMHELTQD
jgi:hypothetical protein